MNNMTPNADLNVLNTIIPRLVRPASGGDGILALEIIDGPYKGVVFSFTKFEVQADRPVNGMVPTKFETKIWQCPENFRVDESFDNFTAEVLIAWLSYINTVDMRVIANVPVREVIH